MLSANLFDAERMHSENARKHWFGFSCFPRLRVEHAPGGVPPMFSGGAGRIHSRVRQRMRQLLASSEVPVFLDTTAKRFLEEGRQAYKDRGLDKESFLDLGKDIQILTWLGDGANEAIACLLGRFGLNANADGIGVEVQKGEETLEYIATG